MSGNYGSSITIEEVTGSRLWSVTLVGAGLPHQGAAWGAENRIPTEFYPGNPVGTQQVIGPKEGPSHFEGVWRRTMLLRSPATITPGGGSQQTATPMTLANFLEQLFLGGARLRVTWTAQKTENTLPGNTPGAPQTVQIVREGRAQRWEFTPLTVDDVKWTVAWRWVSRGQQQQSAVATRDGSSSATAAQVQSSLTDAINLTGTLASYQASDPTVPLSATPTTLGEAETLSPDLTDEFGGFNSSLLSFQSQLQATVSLQVTVGSNAQIDGAVLNLAGGVVVECNTFTDTIGQMPFEVMSSGTDAGSVAFAAGVAADAVLQAWVTREEAQRARQKALALLSANPGGGQKGQQATAATGPTRILAVYRTRQGDTAQRVARMFYGNADKALDLLKANHMPLGQPSFVPGTVIIVPVLRSASPS